MAETEPISLAAAPVENAASPPTPSPQPARASLAQMYALPVPVRTFPLPSFYPGNPLSWLYVAWVVLRQTLLPPPAEPLVVHVGVWDAGTGSVHVKDARAIRALWEQGFFGKGNLSRSEPNWFKRQQIERGLVEGKVSEAVTEERRQERRRAKWERARAEQEVIRQTRLQEMLEKEVEEAAENQEAANQEAEKESVVSAGHEPSVLNTDSAFEPLVLHEANGNGAQLSHESVTHNVTSQGHVRWQHRPPVGPLELLALPNSAADLASLSGPVDAVDPVDSSTASRQSSAPDTSSNAPDTATETPDPETPSRRRASSDSPPHSPKGVRFSNLIESTTFDTTDPPSPNRSPRIVTTLPHVADYVFSPLQEPLDDVLVDKEHLQLCPEEAFFLAFGLGALSVVDPETKEQIPNETLFTLFRQYSHFPPLATTALQPHSNFLVQYAVYHHYRALGWAPRVGIKFGVDWLLYYRGPVFDHAEFGIIVLPSFTDPWWKTHEAGQARPPRTWAWLHGVLRVLSRVMKTFVIAYVEVPPPPTFDAALRDGGAAAAMALYRVREVTVRRWSANRNRKGTTPTGRPPRSDHLTR